MQRNRRNSVVTLAVFGIVMLIIAITVGVLYSTQPTTSHQLASNVKLAKPVVSHAAPPLSPAAFVAGQIGCEKFVDPGAKALKEMNAGDAAGTFSDIGKCTLLGKQYAILTYTSQAAKDIMTLGLQTKGADPSFQGPTWAVYTAASIVAAS